MSSLCKKNRILAWKLKERTKMYSWDGYVHVFHTSFCCRKDNKLPFSILVDILKICNYLFVINKQSFWNIKWVHCNQKFAISEFAVSTWLLYKIRGTKVGPTKNSSLYPNVRFNRARYGRDVHDTSFPRGGLWVLEATLYVNKDVNSSLDTHNC